MRPLLPQPLTAPYIRPTGLQALLGLPHTVPSAQRTHPQLKPPGVWANVTSSQGPSCLSAVTVPKCLETLLVNLSASPHTGAPEGSHVASPTATHHQLGTPLQLQGLGCLLLQVQELLLPQEVLLGEELKLLRVVQGTAARRVQRRPEGWHGGPLHELRWGDRQEGAPNAHITHAVAWMLGPRRDAPRGPELGVACPARLQWARHPHPWECSPVPTATWTSLRLQSWNRPSLDSNSCYTQWSAGRVPRGTSLVVYMVFLSRSSSKQGPPVLYTREPRTSELPSASASHPVLLG